MPHTKKDKKEGKIERQGEAKKKKERKEKNIRVGRTKNSVRAKGRRTTRISDTLNMIY